MNKRFKVVLTPYHSSHHSNRREVDVTTTDKILLIDQKGVYKAAEFKDVMFAEICCNLLNGSLS